MKIIRQSTRPTHGTERHQILIQTCALMSLVFIFGFIYRITWASSSWKGSALRPSSGSTVLRNRVMNLAYLARGQDEQRMGKGGGG